jgi:hypothetical protein
MSFDFTRQFKEYSNKDLLLIVKRPNEYQPEAIKAANEILASRIVTTDDQAEADANLEDINLKKARTSEKFHEYKGKTEDLLSPLLHPTAVVNPEKWFNILLVVVGVQSVWIVLRDIRSLTAFIKFMLDCNANGFEDSLRPASFWTCFSAHFDFFSFLQLASLIYVPIIFFLLFKRRRWGWILMFADSLFTFISSIGESWIFFKYQHIHQGETASFLAVIAIKGAFAFFLQRSEICNLFGVNNETKKNTAMVTIVVTILVLVLVPAFI